MHTDNYWYVNVSGIDNCHLHAVSLHKVYVVLNCPSSTVDASLTSFDRLYLLTSNTDVVTA